MKKTLLFLLFCVTSVTMLLAQKFKTIQKTDGRGYRYEEVTNDPTKARVYTLSNGLTVYLSKNVTAPRIQTYIPVRAGSNNDPADNTGLAHYLEHMLFKGTSRMGSLNWEKEKVELQKISNLYERHKLSKDSLERRRLYHQIDSISQVASKYVSANEYDRLTSSIGATRVNAHTWVEETVYTNNIPSNELERWLKIESERFDELTLRLFHTEIEAVYEEFNMGQDNTYRRVMKVQNELLFPTHPYGQQTTIGTSEHLKSPSLEALHHYFNKYYIPNNYAIVLVGDLDYDQTIAWVDKYFGKKKAKKLVHPTFPREAPITSPRVADVYSKDAEFVGLSYRFDGGTGSEDEVYLTLIDRIFSNGKAGLIDLNLNLAQKVLQASSYPMVYKEYSVHNFYANPNPGQTLEQARDLLFSQIEKVKAGDFPDWLLTAVINEIELDHTKGSINANQVATYMYNAFIHQQKWADRLSFTEKLRKVKKADIVAFAKKHYNNNYVLINKRQGDNPNLIRVENPGITPINIDRNAMSEFGKNLLAEEAPRLKPLFVDFKKDIKKTKAGALDVEYILNTENDLFELTYHFDFGSFGMKGIQNAADYFSYLGTDKLTATQVQQEFYKLGISFNISVQNKNTYITLSGLKQNFEAGVRLFEEVLKNIKPDDEALKNYVEQVIKARMNERSNKEQIFDAAVMYGKYGKNSPLLDITSVEYLKGLKGKDLTDMLKSLMTYKHKIFYYGNDIENARKVLAKYHKAGTRPVPANKEYKQLPTGGKVYYTNYDMVQTQMMIFRRVDKFNAKDLACERLFNSYFGGGMGSIVFQEIRESKSLAYSAYAYYGGANNLQDYNYLTAFIGTQANKLPEALKAMEELITNMPESEKSFETAKELVLRTIEAERIVRSSIYWRAEGLRKVGIYHDHRREIYEEVKKLSLQDLVRFFNEKIKGGDYTFVLIGRESDLPLDMMKNYGEVQKLELDDIFSPIE